jgi:hypothetical protein
MSAVLDGTVEATHGVTIWTKPRSVCPTMLPVTTTVTARLWLEAIALIAAGSGAVQALRLKTAGTNSSAIRTFEVIFNYPENLLFHRGTGKRSHDIQDGHTVTPAKQS